MKLWKNFIKKYGSNSLSLWKDGIHDLDRIARLTELTVEDVRKAIASIPE